MVGCSGVMGMIIGSSCALWVGEDSGDVPRMRQRSAKIGDLSVNPMWF